MTTETVLWTTWGGVVALILVAWMVAAGWDKQVNDDDSLIPPDLTDAIGALAAVALWPLMLIVALLTTPFWAGVAAGKIHLSRLERAERARQEHQKLLETTRDLFEPGSMGHETLSDLLREAKEDAQ